MSQGSTLEPRTTLTDEARGAKAAAEAGRSWTGMANEGDSRSAKPRSGRASTALRGSLGGPVRRGVGAGEREIARWD